MIGRGNRKIQLPKKIRFPSVKRKLIKHFGSAGSLDFPEDVMPAEANEEEDNHPESVSMIVDHSKEVNNSMSDLDVQVNSNVNQTVDQIPNNKVRRIKLK